MTVTQLVRNFARILCNPKVHCRIQNSQPLKAVLCQLNSFRTHIRHFLTNRFNIVFSIYTCLLNGDIWFVTQNTDIILQPLLKIFFDMLYV